MVMVYILYSNKLNKYYIGQTTNIENRIHQHNNVLNTNWTKRANDWELKLEILCTDISKAIKLERFIKNKRVKNLLRDLSQI
jgi:putative endonuclease